MPRKTIILSLLVILFARISCYSSDSHLELRHLDAMPGSYNNLITALHKHSGGMLWFGTSSGLCRYDGYNVKQVNGGITDSTTILNDHILNIHEDCRGKLCFIAAIDTGYMIRSWTDLTFRTRKA